MENNELQHHGTKGMKWGQRLYQNKDGSLTALGRARMGYKKRAAAKKRQATIKAKKKAAEAEKKAVVDKAQKKDQVLKSRSAKELYDNAPLFDDVELARAYNRLVLEKNIKNLQPEEVSKGKQFIKKAIEVGDTAAKLMGTAGKVIATGQNLSSKVKGLVGDSDSDSSSSSSTKKKATAKKETSKKDDTDSDSKGSSSKTKKETFGPDDYEILDPDDGYGSGKSDRSTSDGRTVYRSDSFVDKSVPTVVRNFVDNDVDVASRVTNFVENNPRLIEAGTNFVAGYLEKHT